MARSTSFVRIFVVAVLAAIALAACGGETPEQREIGSDDDGGGPVAEVPGSVELAYRRGAFQVAVDADANYCFEGRKVIIFKDLGKDQRVGVVTTDADGEASLKDKKANGKYFAQMTQSPSAKYGDLSICLGDKSNKLRA